MLKQFKHNNMGGEPCSAVWAKREAIKDFDQPRLVICLPVGSKILHNAFPNPAPGNKEVERVEENVGLSPAVRIPAVVPVQWLTAQMQLVHPLNYSTIYLTQYGKLAGEARQILTMAALKYVQPDGFILYWDDDTLPPPMGLYTMANYMEQHPEVGILSGVYCTRETPAEPVAYRESTHGAFWEFEMGKDVEPTEVAAVGAGFMLCRVSAIVKAINENPGEPIWADMKATRTGDDSEYDDVWGNGITWGHDIRFCRLIRLAGFKVMLDGRVECGHLDINTQVIHKLPDTCPPKMRGKYRGEQYWNALYGDRGAAEMHVRPDLLRALLTVVPAHSKVVEVGCGPGVAGQLLAAQLGVHWTGFDKALVAVNQCNGKFLNAYQKAACDITEDDLSEADVLLAMELFEHLIPDDRDYLLKQAAAAGVKRIIFTVPEGAETTTGLTGYTAAFVPGDGDMKLAVLDREDTNADSLVDTTVLRPGHGDGEGSGEELPPDDGVKRDPSKGGRRRRKRSTPAT